MKELIQRWRTSSAELKEKNKELEKARESLHSLDSEHSQRVRHWDLEKENIKNTIDVILDQVKHKQDELERIENESAELRRKVEERRKRNEEYQVIITKRKQTVQARREECDARDDAVRSRLDTFEQSRDESRNQLLAAIQKIENTLPSERLGHEQKIRLLRSKTAEIDAAIEAEAKSFALEQAVKEWNEKFQLRKVLLDEVGAAEEGKDVWAGLLNDARSLGTETDLMRRLSDIRASVSV